VRRRRLLALASCEEEIPSLTLRACMDVPIIPSLTLRACMDVPIKAPPHKSPRRKPGDGPAGERDSHLFGPSAEDLASPEQAKKFGQRQHPAGFVRRLSCPEVDAEATHLAWSKLRGEASGPAACLRPPARRRLHFDRGVSLRGFAEKIDFDSVGGPPKGEGIPQPAVFEVGGELFVDEGLEQGSAFLMAASRIASAASRRC